MRKSMIEGILSGCKNIYGNPLSIETRKRIREFLVNPSVETWEKISCIVISNRPVVDIWSALVVNESKVNDIGINYEIKGDEFVPVSEWDYIPTPMEVLLAIKNMNNLLNDNHKATRKMM